MRPAGPAPTALPPAAAPPPAAQRLWHGIGVAAMTSGGVALLAFALVLWWRHGATVFFDVLSAGIASCL
ncbi:hypothetical protein V5F53_12655 [Xanthobacter sp. V4C-4]|uniref:hypothetical protein n=1 Tax=Xanthobacter cornucopiae TaxID=3119924 RepID=UPI00372B4165